MTDTLTVQSVDGTDSEAITVTITGANDGATISGTATGSLTEDGATTVASGTLSVSDVDTGEAAFRTPASLAGTYGTFTFNATTGAWTYELDNSKASVQALKDGVTVTDTLTVQSVDGTDSEAITVTITGANDAPVASSTSFTTLEDQPKILTLIDFGNYADDEGSALAAVQITSLASDGSLQFNAGTLSSPVWQSVTLNQQFSSEDIAAGKLRFAPDANENGNNYASFAFKVSDGSAWSQDSYTSTVSVTPVNDPVYANISLVGSSSQVESSQSAFTFVVRLTDSNGQPAVVDAGKSLTVTLNWSGTALPADLASSLPTQIMIGQNTSSTQFIVNVADDFSRESSETLVATLTSVTDANNAFDVVSVGNNSTVTATIVDETVNDDVSVPESYDDNDVVTIKLISVDVDGNIINGGTANSALEGQSAYYKTIAVDMNGNEIAGVTGSVNIQYTNITTTATDYTVSSNTVQLGTVFSVLAKSDGSNETTSETLKVSLVDGSFTAASGYEGVSYAGEVVTTIADRLSVSSVEVNEESGGFAVFTVGVSSLAAGRPVDLSLGAGTAAAGSDYSSTIQYSLNGGATWTTGSRFWVPTGGVSALVRVEIIDDVLADSGETFTLSASYTTTGGTTYSSTGQAVILDSTSNDNAGAGDLTDNDAAFTLKLVAVDANDQVLGMANSVSEFGGVAYFKVLAYDQSGQILATQPSGTTIVAVGSQTDTATPGSDYRAEFRKEVIIGERFSVTAIDDAQPDVNEFFTTSLIPGSYSDSDAYESISYSSQPVVTTVVDNDNNPAVPDALPYELSIVEGGSGGGGSGSVADVNTNLILMIDVSGSMTTTEGGISRLQYAKNATISLLDAYDAIGNVSVQIIKFSSSATNVTNGVWVTADQAKALVLGLTASGYTNYDRVLDKAMTIKFDASGAQTTNVSNVSYFFSDGNPTEDSAGKRNTSFSLDPDSSSYQSQDIGIQAGEAWAWQNYLNANQVVSHAYGIGNSNLNIGYLEPVAWNGGTASDISAIRVNDLSQFESTLTDNISPPTPIFYNLIDQSGSEPGPDGWPLSGQKLVSVTYNGQTYTFVDATTPVTIETSSGDITIQGNGNYSFTPVAGDFSEDVVSEVTFVVQDRNGDTDSSVLTLRVNDKSDVTTVNDVNVATVNVVPGEPITTTLFNGFEGFSLGSGNNYTDMGTNYNQNVLTNDSRWASTTINGNTRDGSIVTSGGDDSLRIIDADGNSSGSGRIAAVATSSINIDTVSGSTKIAFDVEGVTNFSGSDAFYWKILKADANGSFVNGTFIYQSPTNLNTTGTYEYTFNETSSDKYRVVFYVRETNSDKVDAIINVDNIRVIQPNPVDTVQLIAATGNVLANDTTGSEVFTPSVQILNPSTGSLDNPGAAGTTIQGQYGTLFIKSDGSYSYTPTGTSSIGQTESFTYRVSQPDGDYSESQLTITVAGDVSHMSGTSSADVLNGTADADALYGGAGNDTISGGLGNDYLMGEAGDDQLSGGGGDDQLIGGDGKDVLIGGAGVDKLTGGAGADTFKIEALSDLTPAGSNKETITDFNFAEGDKVDFGALLSNPSLVKSNTIQINASDASASKSLMKIVDGSTTYELLVDNAAVATSADGYKELDSQSLLGLSGANSTSGSWTDVVNVTGTYKGFSDLQAPGANEWTLKVLTDGVQVQVDEETKQVEFIKNGQATEASVQITTGDGMTHEISNVDKITW